MSNKRNANQPSSTGKPRRALVIYIVLVVIVIISLGSYTFNELMFTHRQASNLTGRQLQARYIVEAAVESITVFLLQDEETQTESGGVYDNPEYFQARNVISDPQAQASGTLDPRNTGNFTVIAPMLDDLGYLAGVRYGLEDESTRLNLNALLSADQTIPNGGRTLLMALPGMTEEIADAILDWIDEDDEPREYGAEFDYYQQLDPPYAPKNGPLNTIEELLLVRGVSPYLLYGNDTNRNGMLDPHETQGAAAQAANAAVAQAQTQSAQADAAESGEAAAVENSLDRGWIGYVTLYSKERNANSLGQPRIFLNSDDLAQLHQDLSNVFSSDWANFIIAYRQASENAEGGQPAQGGTLDFERPAQRAIANVMDLIDVSVQAQFANENRPATISSPFTTVGANQYLATLLDNCTVTEGESIPGRLNVNLAPRALLLGVPGMTEEIADRLIEERAAALEDTSGIFNSEAWLITAAVVTVPELKTMLPYICTGGNVYRGQIIGYFEEGTASSRAEVIFDSSSSTPQILFWRDISHLGRGYPLEQLGVRAQAALTQ